MRIAIGCDHRGFALKQAIISLLLTSGYDYYDFGCYDRNPVDYPDLAQKVGKAVASGQFDYGILICGTGIGMSIAANKIRGIRAALCCDKLAAERARKHNDANVICLRGENTDERSALEMVTTFLTTDFEGGRHRQRLEKIRALEGDI